MVQQELQPQEPKHKLLSDLFETLSILNSGITPPVFHALLSALRAEVEKKSLGSSHFSLAEMDALLQRISKNQDEYLTLRIQVDIHIHQYQTTRLKHLDYHRLTRSTEELEQLLYELQKLVIALHVPIVVMAEDELYQKKISLDAILKVYDAHIHARRLHQQREKTLV